MNQMKNRFKPARLLNQQPKQQQIRRGQSHIIKPTGTKFKTPRNKATTIKQVSSQTLHPEKFNEIIAQNLEYFRISLDAGSPEMYKKIHGMKDYHFTKTLQNIEKFAITKQKMKSKISFGVGFLTSEITQSDMESFIKLVKDRGADFAQFRPFTGDTLDITPHLQELKNKYEDSNFKIVASYQKYKEMQDVSVRGYDKCHGMFFSTVISADFKVWACLHFRQSNNHFLGDLREQIWRGNRIKEVYESIDCSQCPILCRNDSFNKTLHYWI